MTNPTIEAIEQNIKELKKFVEAGEALERLQGNRDFKLLVTEGYFKDEAIRLVHLKADPNFQTPDRQQTIVSQMDAIGALSHYFNTVFQKASMADKAIEADEETRDEMLNEDLTK